MEDEDRIQAPYYAMAYLDDDNIKHLTNLRDTNEVDFYKDRFNVLECNYIRT